ncbi:MAG: EAL domain-containing protein [Clostridia bacterium]|nr:EAL domain-containing protein [Clostridia bacterium]
MEELEKDFLEGIKNGEFKIFIQPKFDVRTLMVVGGEALIRRVKNNEIIMPKFFIPEYEKTGIITRLNMFVFESICKKLKELKDKGYRLIPISINESAKDLYDENHISKLKHIMEKYEVNPSLIELELTETVVLEDIENAKEAEKKVHSLGCVVSMDDFGVGYSSFSMLRKIHIDVLKIDKSFSDEVLNDERGKIILESIIQMAKRLEIKTVAEGIETKEQVEYLKNIGCDMVQGYYFEKPLTIEQFEEKYLLFLGPEQKNS